MIRRVIRNRVRSIPGAPQPTLLDPGRSLLDPGLLVREAPPQSLLAHGEPEQATGQVNCSMRSTHLVHLLWVHLFVGGGQMCGSVTCGFLGRLLGRPGHWPPPPAADTGRTALLHLPLGTGKMD